MDKEMRLRLNAIEGAIQMLLRATLALAPATQPGSERDPLLKDWVEIKVGLKAGLEQFTKLVES